MGKRTGKVLLKDYHLLSQLAFTELPNYPFKTENSEEAENGWSVECKNWHYEELEITNFNSRNFNVTYISICCSILRILFYNSILIEVMNKLQ